jgi:hypothetical protein
MEHQSIIFRSVVMKAIKRSNYLVILKVLSAAATLGGIWLSDQILKHQIDDAVDARLNELKDRTEILSLGEPTETAK